MSECVSECVSKSVSEWVVESEPGFMPSGAVWHCALMLALYANLAIKKTPTPLGPPWYPRHRSTVGS